MQRLGGQFLRRAIKIAVLLSAAFLLSCELVERGTPSPGISGGEVAPSVEIATGAEVAPGADAVRSPPQATVRRPAPAAGATLDKVSSPPPASPDLPRRRPSVAKTAAPRNSTKVAPQPRSDKAKTSEHRTASQTPPPAPPRGERPAAGSAVVEEPASPAAPAPARQDAVPAIEDGPITGQLRPALDGAQERPVVLSVAPPAAAAAPIVPTRLPAPFAVGPTPIRDPRRGQGCECPYDIAGSGQTCDGESEWSRPDGSNPACYAEAWGKSAATECLSMEASRGSNDPTMRFCPSA